LKTSEKDEEHLPINEAVIHLVLVMCDTVGGQSTSSMKHSRYEIQEAWRSCKGFPS
jgi:hypothetical protein